MTQYKQALEAMAELPVAGPMNELRDRFLKLMEEHQIPFSDGTTLDPEWVALRSGFVASISYTLERMLSVEPPNA